MSAQPEFKAHTTPLNPEKRSESGVERSEVNHLRRVKPAWISPLGYGNISLTRVGAEPRGCGDVTRHRAARRVSAEVSPDGEEESFCYLHSSAHAVSVEHREREKQEGTHRGQMCVLDVCEQTVLSSV